MALVSVIIPAYNSGRYLLAAMDSVIQQDHDELELIVVDDGSEDDTRELAEGFARRYPGLVRYIHQQNAGVSAARNHGILSARGKYLAFLDSDDLLLPGSIRKRHDFLEGHEDIQAVFSDYDLIDREGVEHPSILRERGFLPTFHRHIAETSRCGIRLAGSWYVQYLSFSPLPVWTGTVMLRRDAIHLVGLFRPCYFTAEDTDYWVHLVRRLEVGYIDEALAVYHHERSTLSARTEAYHLNVLHIFQGLLGATIDEGVRAVIRQRLHLGHYQLAFHYRAQQQLSAARWHLLQSIRYAPLAPAPYLSLASTFIPAWLLGRRG